MPNAVLLLETREVGGGKRRRRAMTDGGSGGGHRWGMGRELGFMVTAGRRSEGGREGGRER